MSVEAQFAATKARASSWWGDGEGGRGESVARHFLYLGFPVFSDAERRRARAHLADDERRFRESGNPLDAWGAILDARRAGVPLPQSVLEYLTRSAEGLLGIGQEHVERERRPERVAETLGLKPSGVGRKRDAFDRWSDPRPGIFLAWDYQAARVWQQRTHEDALERVSRKHGVSESTVKQAWTRWRDRL